jgi:[protein-PII] uridylyltransferase
MTTADPYAELGFIADDRPGLLAMITAALAAARIKVVSAQVYNWVDTFGRTRALDLFWVRAGTSAQAAGRAIARLEKDFERLLSRELSPADLVTGGERSNSWSDRPSPRVATDVHVDNRAASKHSVIEVTTKDQVGLLFWLANTLQSLGLTITLAKINTEGTQVADVFYVTDAEGKKVTDPDTIELIRSRLTSVIARLESQKL